MGQFILCPHKGGRAVRYAMFQIVAHFLKSFLCFLLRRAHPTSHDCTDNKCGQVKARCRIENEGIDWWNKEIVHREYGEDHGTQPSEHSTEPSTREDRAEKQEQKRVREEPLNNEQFRD